MEKAKHSVRFETTVQEDGSIRFSRRADELRLKPGAAVTVNVFGGALSKQLKKLRVTEEEIEAIGNRQFEDREHVITFLSSQGMLAGKKPGPKRGKR